MSQSMKQYFASAYDDEVDKKPSEFFGKYSFEAIKHLAFERYHLGKKSDANQEEAGRMYAEFDKDGWRKVITMGDMYTYLSSGGVTKTIDNNFNMGNHMRKFKSYKYTYDTKVNGVRVPAVVLSSNLDGSSEDDKLIATNGYFTEESVQKSATNISLTQGRAELVQDLTSSLVMGVDKKGVNTVKAADPNVPKFMQSSVPMFPGDSAVTIVVPRIERNEISLPVQVLNGTDLASSLAKSYDKVPDVDIVREMNKVATTDPSAFKTRGRASYKDDLIPGKVLPVRIVRPGPGIMNSLVGINNNDALYTVTKQLSDCVGGVKSFGEYAAQEGYDGVPHTHDERRWLLALRNMSLISLSPKHIYALDLKEGPIAYFIWKNLGEKKGITMSYIDSNVSSAEEYKSAMNKGGLLSVRKMPYDNFASLWGRGKPDVELKPVIFVDLWGAKGINSGKAKDVIEAAESTVSNLIGSYGDRNWVTMQHVLGTIGGDILHPCYMGHMGYVLVSSSAGLFKEVWTREQLIAFTLLQAQFGYMYRYIRRPWQLCVDWLEKNYRHNGSPVRMWRYELPDVMWAARATKKNPLNADIYQGMVMANDDDWEQFSLDVKALEASTVIVKPGTKNTHSASRRTRQVQEPPKNPVDDREPEDLADLDEGIPAEVIEYEQNTTFGDIFKALNSEKHREEGLDMLESTSLLESQFYELVDAVTKAEGSLGHAKRQTMYNVRHHYGFQSGRNDFGWAESSSEEEKADTRGRPAPTVAFKL